MNKPKCIYIFLFQVKIRSKGNIKIVMVYISIFPGFLISHYPKKKKKKNCRAITMALTISKIYICKYALSFIFMCHY